MYEQNDVFSFDCCSNQKRRCAIFHQYPALLRDNINRIIRALIGRNP